MSRCMLTVCLPHGRYMDIRIGLFIISMDHVLLVYIYSVEIHWGLLVEFFCDLHEILHL